MKKSEITALVTALMNQITAGTDTELVDVEYVKESGRYFLRVYIDKPGGVTVDDCHRITVSLSEQLDLADPIDHAYTLEVSSPGLDRPLKKTADFRRNIGRRVTIKTYQPFNGQKQFEGKLVAVEDGVVKLDVGERQVELPYEQIAKARLVVEF
ncbi:MAG: ribosome maturation factor RimP [Firmicutes bacterium]|jgi:ribosome maturation factor RimP|nr:ribosome maturation factor RimP [Bacillota bacterium]NLL88053.1 ribosome maturation factor RimP [Bacillota bacterium]HKM18032.1 ribosome maturation factor RimP [Limnochordia bacterium]